MNCEKVKNHIVDWLCTYLKESGLKGFVVGVSGGVDSALVSTLCAMTGLPTICVTMPINGPPLDRANEHLKWLKDKYPDNVTVECIDLTDIFWAYKDILNYYQTELAMVNLSSRIRMVALYAISNSRDYLVLGTGNKIEDSGIGFHTRYGDGAVDISPIGDLTKTEVYEIGGYLEIISSILRAEPSDGLWEDGRTDEDQIGATYPELEWAMEFCDKLNISTLSKLNELKSFIKLDEKQMKVLSIYLTRHERNMFKMEMPPICSLKMIK